MMPFDLSELSAQPWVQALGWTFLHACWQGCAVVLVVGAALWLLDLRQARARYACCAAGFAAMLVCVAVTLVRCWPAELAAATPLPAMPLPLGDPTLLERIVPWCALFWAAGTSLLHARLMTDFFRMRRLMRSGLKPAPKSWQRSFTRIKNHVGTRSRVILRESNRVLAPMVVGWLRPIVLVPPSIWSGLAPHQIEAILAHELAHVRRNDFLINLIQSLGEALLFFHPGVWWLSHRMRIEREHCCDDVAVAICGDPVSYARALQSLDEMREAKFRPALASTGGSLMSRIQRLVAPTRARSRRSLGLSVAGMSLLAVLSLGAAKAGAFGTDDEHEAHGKDVDIVKVVAAVDKDQAKLLAMLRAQGLNDAGLRMVVQHYVDSPEIAAALEKAHHGQKIRRQKEDDLLESRSNTLRWNADLDKDKRKDIELRKRELLRAEQELSVARDRIDALKAEHLKLPWNDERMQDKKNADRALDLVRVELERRRALEMAKQRHADILAESENARWEAGGEEHLDAAAMGRYQELRDAADQATKARDLTTRYSAERVIAETAAAQQSAAQAATAQAAALAAYAQKAAYARKALAEQRTVDAQKAIDAKKAPMRRQDIEAKMKELQAVRAQLEKRLNDLQEQADRSKAKLNTEWNIRLNQRNAELKKDKERKRRDLDD